MRHYEIVILIHPDQSAQVPAMTERYRGLIEGGDGVIHRFEDWGRRQLAYPINKIHKAHYLLMNIECGEAVMAELENGFRFNDAIIRHLTLRVDNAITGPSPMMRSDDANKDQLISDEDTSNDESTDESEDSDDSEEKSIDEADPVVQEAEPD